MNEQYILGIDISKNHFDVALLLPQGKRKNKKFDSTLQGFNALAVWLKSHEVDSLHACMEATNTYGHALAEFLFDLGFDASLVNTARIKGFAQSELLRTKTDKQDASLIARFCKPSLWNLDSKQVRELKALVRRLDALTELHQQEVNRLDVAEAVVRQNIESHVQMLSKRINEVRELIQQHIDDDPDLRQQNELLLSIPGIGEKTVAAILSYFSTVSNFSSAKKLASFWGFRFELYNQAPQSTVTGGCRKWGLLSCGRHSSFRPWWD